MILARDGRSVRKETHPSGTLPYANPIKTRLGLNPGLCSDKLMTNRLAHRTA